MSKKKGITIGVTGGTGFIGGHLARMLVADGNEVVIFTTHPGKKKDKPGFSYSYWDPKKGTFDLTCLTRLNAIVNLAGAGIADKRWTDSRKKEIVNSRVQPTDFLTSQLKEYAEHCKVLVSASAIGYYGPDREGTTPFKESAEPYNDFLGDTCKQWETAARSIEDSMRTVIFRFGIVMGRENGAFKKLAQPMALGVMPVLGNGKQVVSWVHMEDLCHMIYHAIKHTDIRGVYNAVTPHPVTHKELMETIAKAKGGIKIPMHVPAGALKLMLGEMSTEVLKSCTVSGQKTQESGFKLQYDTIEKAVEDILSKHYS